MYLELAHFSRRIVCTRAFWKDGELWTAVVGGVACYCWLGADPSVVERIRQHFGDLLGVASIVFGFALAALLFYVQAAGEWATKPGVGKVAEKLVDWHVWTILCLLALIGYILGLWALGIYLDNQSVTGKMAYAFLAFLILYSGFQHLNHTLTIWWVFQNRGRLTKQSDEEKPTPGKASRPRGKSET